jgi:hypothetical protein
MNRTALAIRMLMILKTRKFIKKGGVGSNVGNQSEKHH